MTPTEASNLAKRIINTWTGGPKLTEWVDALTPLDVGASGTAFVRLRNEAEHAPSIARFIATYRSLDVVGRSDQRHYPPGIPASDPRAKAAMERGYLLGQHDLWRISGGKLGVQPHGTGEDF